MQNVEQCPGFDSFRIDKGFIQVPSGNQERNHFVIRLKLVPEEILLLLLAPGRTIPHFFDYGDRFRKSLGSQIIPTGRPASHALEEQGCLEYIQSASVL